MTQENELPEGSRWRDKGTGETFTIVNGLAVYGPEQDLDQPPQVGRAEDAVMSAGRGLSNIPVGISGLLDMFSEAQARFDHPAGSPAGGAWPSAGQSDLSLSATTQGLLEPASSYEPQYGTGKAAMHTAEALGSLALPGGGGAQLIRGGLRQGVPILAGTAGGQAGVFAAQEADIENEWVRGALPLVFGVGAGGISQSAAQGGRQGVQRMAAGADIREQVGDAVGEGQLPPSFRQHPPQTIIKAKREFESNLPGRNVTQAEIDSAMASGNRVLANDLVDQRRLWDDAHRVLEDASARQAAGQRVSTTAANLAVGSDVDLAGYGVKNLETEIAKRQGSGRVASRIAAAKREADETLSATVGNEVVDDAAANIETTLASRLDESRQLYRTGDAYKNAPPVDGRRLSQEVREAYKNLSASQQLELDPFELSVVDRAMEQTGSHLIPLSDADDMAKSLKAAARRAASGDKPDRLKQSALMKMLAVVEKHIDYSITASAKGSGSDGARLLEARKAFKKATNDIDPPRPSVGASAHARASYAAREALRQKTGDGIIRLMLSPGHRATSPEVIARVRSVLGAESAEWATIQNAARAKMVARVGSVDSSSGATRIIKTLRQKNSPEARGYRQILGDDDFEEVLDAIQAKRVAAYSGAGQSKQVTMTGSSTRPIDLSLEDVAGGSGGRLQKIFRSPWKGSVEEALNFLPESSVHRLLEEVVADPSVASFILKMTPADIEAMILQQAREGAARAAARGAPSLGREGGGY